MAGTNGLDWRLDIGRTRSLDIVGMPLLDHHVTTLGPTLLAGTDILYINHLISDSLMVARGFKRLGARLTSIAIPYSGIYAPYSAPFTRASSTSVPPSCPGSPTPASSRGDVGGGPPRHRPPHWGAARWRAVDDRRGRRLRLPRPARRPHPLPAPGLLHL